jgi:ribonuclease BN (tRNA processing enzyme)
MKFDLLVVSIESLDYHPSVAIIFENDTYLFNVPDQTQRIISSQLNISKIKHIFFTSTHSRSMNGFHGLLLAHYGTRKSSISLSGLTSEILKSFKKSSTKKSRSTTCQQFS